MPLLNFSVQDVAKFSRFDITQEDRPRKRWYTYAPLALAVFLILIHQFPYFVMLSSFYFVTTHSTAKFVIHSTSVVILTLLTLTYLTICSTRDPGFVRPLRDRGRAEDATTRSESEQALLEADRATEQVTSEDVTETEVEKLVILGKWCKKCSIHRPERAHHCSTCGRCVLKMDHHCPWLGGNCVGFRNYSSFVYFVSTATLLSTYMSAVAIAVVIHLVRDPFTADPDTSPLYALFIALSGAVFALSLGSFTIYHLYLITINQTTFENISPFHILRYVPPPKPHVPPLPSAVSSRPNLKITSEFVVPSRSLDSPLFFDGLDPIEPLHNENSDHIHLQRLETGISHMRDSPAELIPHPSLPIPPYKPPEEYELSSAQRRFVLHMHRKLRIYDLGWKRNWEEAFGGELVAAGDKRNDDSVWRNRIHLRWLKLLLTGGRQKGDGWYFEKTANIDAKLERFAKMLRKITEEESR